MYTIADIKQANSSLKNQSLYIIDRLNTLLSQVGEKQIQPSSANYNVLASDAEVIAKNLNSIKAAVILYGEKLGDVKILDEINQFSKEVLGEEFGDGGEISRFAVMDSTGTKIGNILSYSETGAHSLVAERYPDHIPGNYSLNFEGMEPVTANHFAQGGSVGVVGAFLRSIDLEALPPKVAHHIKTEILSDPDIELLLSDDDGREKFELIKNLLQPYVKKATSEEPKPHEAGIDTETAKAEQQAKQKALADRLELLREMLEEDKDNDTLKDRIELLEEMLIEVGEDSFGNGGKLTKSKGDSFRFVEFEYRDASNYKFHFKQPYEKVKSILGHEPAEGEEMTYEQLGFSQNSFHEEVVGYEAGEDDHNIVEIISTNEDEFACGGRIKKMYAFGGMIDATKLKYQDNYTGLNYVIDITKSRHEFAVAAAEKYVKEGSSSRKRVTPKVISFFEQDSGAYHAVRDIVESVVVGEKSNPETFEEAVRVFKKYYPIASKDWKAALETGLLVKAGDRQYATSPYYFTQPLAEEIREARLGDKLREIIENKILEPAMA